MPNQPNSIIPVQARCIPGCEAIVSYFNAYLGSAAALSLLGLSTIAFAAGLFVPFSKVSLAYSVPLTTALLVAAEVFFALSLAVVAKQRWSNARQQQATRLAKGSARPSGDTNPPAT